MIAARTFHYSDNEIEQIATWLKDGSTASGIARLFIDTFGRYISRSAVIGLVHRHPSLAQVGFKQKTARTKPKQTGKLSSARIVNKREGRKRDPGFVAPPKALPVSEAHLPSNVDHGNQGISLTALGLFECRFAVNDAAIGEEHLFCGAPSSTGSPYCQHHAARAFNGFVSDAMRMRFSGRRAA